MTDRILRRGGLVGLLASTTAFLWACSAEEEPPRVASLARPDDVAFLCVRQDQAGGEREFFAHRSECTTCDCDEILAFVSQSGRNEVGIVRLDGPSSTADGPIDTDQRIPLYTGVPVGPEGHLPGVIVAVAQLGHAFVANRGSSYISAVPFGAAYETPAVVEQIELAAPATVLVSSAQPESLRLYAALPATGQIAVLSFTDQWPAEPPEIRYLNLAGNLSSCGPADEPDAGPVELDGGPDADVDDANPADGAPVDAEPGGDASDGAVTKADGGSDGRLDEPPYISDLVAGIAAEGDDILYAALSDVPCIAVVRPEVDEVTHFASERPTRRLALVPGADDRVVARSALPDRGGPWLYALDAERSGLLVYNLTSQGIEDLGEGHPLVSYPGIRIPGLAREIVIAENYPEICENGLDDDDDGTVDEQACQKAGTSWSDSVPQGVFALISSSNGKLYIVAVQDEWKDTTGELNSRCVVDEGEGPVYDATRPACRRHQWYLQTDVTNELPRLVDAPTLFASDLETTLEFGAESDVSRFVGDPTLGGADTWGLSRYVPSFAGEPAPTGTDGEPLSYDTHGIFFNWLQPWWPLNETWSLTYEGVLPGSKRSSGNVSDPVSSGRQGVFEDERGVSFCAVGVEAGDFLVITSSHTASGEQAQACDVDYLHDGIFAPLSYFIAEVHDSWLAIQQAPGGPPLPREACFGEAVSYEIRTSQWLLQGEATGFLHRRTADESGDRCVDSELTCPAVTCDTARYADGVAEAEPAVLLRRNDPADSRCLLNGRVTSGEAFANPFFCFFFEEDAGVDKPARDDLVSWTVTDAFRRRVVDAGSLPTRVRYNSWDQLLYVLDPSELGLVQVSLNGLTQTTNYR
jgi:hypothetical protein